MAATKPLQPSAEDTGSFRSAEAEAVDQSMRDRIAEAYLGRWGSQGTQQRARRRVDWMAASVRGPRVLDIGCSEGILAVLLARAGHRVVGVDIEPAAIAAAQRLLSDEPAPVPERVEWRIADALTVHLGAGAFDTVVLGQILEHLEDPSVMLERAFAWLKPGAQLVLTAPFGYLPHPDHRQ
jgi:2-polyprenyl-3-methyl-5-hydroxy-6-metoxy-1,4-benzoquinol methylase